MSQERSDWTSVITPPSGWIKVDVGELWEYRDLVFLFIHRNLVAQFKQTILGPLWLIVQPIVLTVTFTIVFGHIARISTDAIPAPLFYMAGTVMWSYFSKTLTVTSSSFISNANIYDKVYFPRLALPLASAISNLASLFVQLLLFGGLILWYGVWHPSPESLTRLALVPGIILLFVLLALGGGTIVASLATRYRDLAQMVSFGVQLLMYTTPVIYPLSQVKGKLRLLVLANPLTPLFEAFRYAVFGKGTLEFEYVGYTVLMTVVLVTLGILLFSRVERTFVDSI